MDKQQVERIIEDCLLPDTCENPELVETHISWLILTEGAAFKIKKPVQYSFLDFSTLEKRKFYCYEELRLNRRMEPEMYEDVLPVTRSLGIDDKNSGDEIIDYALKMKRMDNNLEMDKLLEQDAVSSVQINKLAQKIARFHENAQVVKNAFNTLGFHGKFADLKEQAQFVEENLGQQWKQKIDDSVQKAFKYLNAIRSFSNERVISGFQRDGHGDLNSRNIFLYDEPVVFDCIEFNSEYRQIDVLNDIAFLCVDLDFFGKENLSNEFYQKYLGYSGFEDEPEIHKLFNFYKSYRANVRAKVTLISAEKKQNENQKELDDAKKYIDLMAGYLVLADI